MPRHVDSLLSCSLWVFVRLCVTSLRFRSVTERLVVVFGVMFLWFVVCLFIGSWLVGVVCLVSHPLFSHACWLATIFCCF